MKPDHEAVSGAGGDLESSAKPTGDSKEETGRQSPETPATPTGEPLDTNVAIAIGDCIDARRYPDEGTIDLFKSDCSTGSLVLDSLQEERGCSPAGQVGVGRGSSPKTHCFTWNVDEGDCLSLKHGHKIDCSEKRLDGKIYRVGKIILGQEDGTKCADPANFVQVGHGDGRGVGCTETIAGSEAQGESEPKITVTLPPAPTAPFPLPR